MSAEEELPEIDEDEVNLGVFPRDSTWGNSIKWDEYERGHGRVHGWKEVPAEKLMFRRVRDGDRFGYQMESGIVAVFEVKNVENESDPRDMFWADAEVVGVVEVEDDEE